MFVANEELRWFFFGEVATWISELCTSYDHLSSVGLHRDAPKLRKIIHYLIHQVVLTIVFLFSLLCLFAFDRHKCLSTSVFYYSTLFSLCREHHSIIMFATPTRIFRTRRKVWQSDLGVPCQYTSSAWWDVGDEISDKLTQAPTSQIMGLNLNMIHALRVTVLWTVPNVNSFLFRTVSGQRKSGRVHDTNNTGTHSKTWKRKWPLRLSLDQQCRTTQKRKEKYGLLHSQDHWSCMSDEGNDSKEWKRRWDEEAGQEQEWYTHVSVSLEDWNKTSPWAGSCWGYYSGGDSGFDRWLFLHTILENIICSLFWF